MPCFETTPSVRLPALQGLNLYPEAVKQGQILSSTFERQIDQAVIGIDMRFARKPRGLI